MRVTRTMTGRERVARQFKRLPVDRIAVYESFWPLTLARWREQGKLGADEPATDHFGFDIEECWPFNLKVDYRAPDKVLAEDEETVTVLDGNGATLRHHKHHASTPEHIGFQVTDRRRWQELARERLTAEPGRIAFEAYRRTRAHAAAKERFFFWSGVNVFECLHPLCGHVNMLAGMAEDPAWVADMVAAYTRLTLALMEILFAAEGLPDGIWFYEDMGFKERPFLSPAMYRELIQPAHRETCAFAHARGLPVMMHSCGFIEPLLPGMVEAGIDGLQAMEVKAGMDLLRIHRRFGDRLALMGGLDVRPVGANDREGIRRELEAKIPAVRDGGGYMLHSDHSIPESTEYDTYRYFLGLGLRLGSYTG